MHRGPAVLRSTVARASALLLVLSMFVVVGRPTMAEAAPEDGLVITGVVDGPLSGGVPKAVELYAVADVEDLSAWGVGSANNGDGSDGEEFTFDVDTVAAGTYLYVASEQAGFTEFFGFAPDATSSALSINGDDAIELYRDGAVVDLFGEIDVDGTGQPWEHTDGWAYRADGTGRDGTTFQLDSWTFSGPDALEGETSNDGASTPFPLGTWSPEGDGDGGGGGEPVAANVAEVQGDGPDVVPGTYTVEAVVTSLFEDGGEVEGFFVQEEDADADGDPATSDGIFVFCGGCPTAVAEGDLVQVTGEATDFFDMSQLVATDTGAVQVVSSGNPLPTPSVVDLPVTAPDLDAFYEAREGMLVTFAGTTVVSEYFQLARFGEVRLFGDARPFQYTQTDDTPTPEEFEAYQDTLARNVVRLDDDDNDQNSPLPDGVIYHPRPGGFSVGTQGTDFFRGGDTVTDLTGVLHWSFAGASDTNAWRVRPTTTAPITFTPVNTRPAAPDDVGGSLTVASFNVLNFFATIDEAGNTCGPNALECRGADSESERVRQLDKIVAALAAIDADVVGLIELENDADDEAVGQVVTALNEASSRTYAAIETGSIGGDAIKVAFIHDTATTTPTGAFAVLDSSVDPRFIDDKNRPILAQTFTETATGEVVTVSVSHLKSKGSPCDDVGDPADPAGAGNCNGTRTDAVAAYLDWVDTDPTGSGDPDHLLIGDLNSYAGEDPIAELTDAGWVDLAERYVGPERYGYVFDGQLGTLDYVFASPTADEQSTGATEWHVNADEVNVFDYNDTIVDPSERSFEAKPSGNLLYAPDAYRSSDHDPAIAGFALDSGPATPTCDGLEATIVGTDAGEVLFGTQGPDVIVGLGGDDLVLGLGGDDVVCGGDGDDRVLSGNGADVVLGEAGDDALLGGTAADRLEGGDGDDTLVGGSGDDLADGGAGHDNLFGGNGRDELRGGTDADRLFGGNGPDRLDGGGAFDIGNGGRGRDTCTSVELAFSCARRE